MPVHTARIEVRKLNRVPTVSVVADQDVQMPEHAVDNGDQLLGVRGVAEIARHADQVRAVAKRGAERGREFGKTGGLSVLVHVMRQMVMYREGRTH